jgi:hypothetical protein
VWYIRQYAWKIKILMASCFSSETYYRINKPDIIRSTLYLLVHTVPGFYMGICNLDTIRYLYIQVDIMHFNCNTRVYKFLTQNLMFKFTWLVYLISLLYKVMLHVTCNLGWRSRRWCVPCGGWTHTAYSPFAYFCEGVVIVSLSSCQLPP